jgi:hypothetical protein
MGTNAISRLARSVWQAIVKFVKRLVETGRETECIRLDGTRAAYRPLIDIRLRTQVILDKLRIINDVYELRRSGKSTALLLYANDLREQGSVVILTPNWPMAENLRKLHLHIFGCGADYRIVPASEHHSVSDVTDINFVLIDELGLLSPGASNRLLSYLRAKGSLAGVVSS